MNSTISMHCYFCEQASPEGSLFCKPCGSPFHLAPCPRCAAVNALTVVSCYKCKAILPIRRAETNAVTGNEIKAESAIDGAMEKTAGASTSEAPLAVVVPTSESTQPAVVKKLRKTGIAPAAKIDAQPVEKAKPSVDDHGHDDKKATQMSPPIVEAQDESYQKTIALPRAPMDVNEIDYQKTIPVRRPLEKIHDEDYQKTIALQRAAGKTLEDVPKNAYDVNYQKTIALQRKPVDMHSEPYLKTISLQHPPASLVGSAITEIATVEGDSPRAMPADLQAEYAALQSVDLVQKAKWGQRALMASLALLLIVAGAYLFLRSQHKAETSAAIDAESLAKLPAAKSIKALDPLPLNTSNTAVPGTKQGADKTPKIIGSELPPAKTAAAKPSTASAPAKTSSTTPATNGRVLVLPPGTTALSAAATAAAIADAIGKKSDPQSTNKSTPANKKADTPVPTSAPAATVTAAPAASPASAPCTEALAALGLCVPQSAAPKP